MTTEYLIRVAREGMFLAVLVSAPIVLSAMVVGLFVSVLQATTQIQEQTLTFAPKVIAVLLALAIASPWIGAQIVRFFAVVLDAVPRV